MSNVINADALRDRIESTHAQYLADLQTIVNIDSGTFDKSGVDAVGAFLRDRYVALGGRIEEHPDATFGDNFTVSWDGRGPGNVLLIGHTDTVFPLGTVLERPFTLADSRAFGPGVADMKSGVLSILYALDSLLFHDFNDFRRLTVVHNSDEEIGSRSSRDLIRECALAADAVFVLEAGRENGDIVSARKGIADIRVHVYGVSAHSGVDHERGRSAVLELAHLVQALEGLNGTVPGATLNVGQLGAGERINVVPDYAFAHLEVRAPSQVLLEQILESVRTVVATRHVDGTTADVAISIEHYPMHKTDVSRRLVERAQSLARELGFEVSDTSTGGASDGNIAAAAGIPVLDGLGPIGGGAHTPNEYINVSSIVPRTALVAGLVAACGTGRW